MDTLLRVFDDPILPLAVHLLKTRISTIGMGHGWPAIGRAHGPGDPVL